MHIQSTFRENDIDRLHALIGEYPLATLVTRSAEGLDANHIPLQLDPQAGKQGVLRGHVARGNPVWQDAGNEPEVLVIFQGGNLYISPNWYANKRETGKGVPTWNYIAVHVSGVLRIHDNPVWLRSHLESLTAVHEAAQAQPWQLSDAPQDYLEKMIKAVVGIEIEIRRIDGKFKLNQNRPLQDRQSVIAALQSGSDIKAAQMAELIDRAANKKS
jgi:transcriptional regulator